MSAPSVKTLYTSALSVENANTEGRVVEISVINCSSKNVSGSLSLMDISGNLITPSMAYNLAPGKFFGNGLVAFGPGRPHVVVFYGVVTVTSGNANDIRASISLRDKNGYTTILAEAR